MRSPSSTDTLARRKNGRRGSREEWLKTLIGATGLSAYELAKAEGFEGSLTEWVASLKGEAGKSAYELAKEAQNFTGSLTEYLASLKGVNGKSAYQSYLDTTTDDPKLTETEWADTIGSFANLIHTITYGTEEQ